jgi:hypothetical protein
VIAWNRVWSDREILEEKKTFYTLLNMRCWDGVFVENEWDVNGRLGNKRSKRR